MLITVLLSLVFAVAPPAGDIVVDSRQTFEEAIAGTSAPDSIVRMLTLVDVEYYSFDGRLHRGQIVIHREAADDIRQIFREIKARKFPIQSVIPIKFDKPGNGTSMDTLNNTYAFHYRPKNTFKTARLSSHAYGRAIDINPFRNPAVLRNDKILPSGGHYDPHMPGTITKDLIHETNITITTNIPFKPFSTLFIQLHSESDKSFPLEIHNFANQIIQITSNEA